MKRTGLVFKALSLICFALVSACSPHGFQGQNDIQQTASPFSSKPSVAAPADETVMIPAQDIDFAQIETTADLSKADYNPDLDPLAVPAPTSKVAPAPVGGAQVQTPQGGTPAQVPAEISPPPTSDLGAAQPGTAANNAGKTPVKNPPQNQNANGTAVPVKPAPAPKTPVPQKPAAPGAPAGNGDVIPPPPDQTGAGVKPPGVFTQQLQKRFPGLLNKGRTWQQLSQYEQTKWGRIFDEMKRVGDIRLRVPLTLLFIDNSVAITASKLFEQDGQISPDGSWTIAVDGTAARHGFSNTPCAEFMSEVLREAYKRAGYDPAEDFIAAKGYGLSYQYTASVTGLSNALVKAGWSVWEASKYKAPIGAIMVHTTGQTPSHTFMSAGDDGSLIVDNSAPKGRDLRKLTSYWIQRCYDPGAFFLPPGQIPEAW